MTKMVIHADDVGMCHGANQAFVELARFGTIGAGSVMVPCPWFPEIAAIASGDDTLDVGVHLTLTAEQQGYRWAPITGPSTAGGLTDEHGYFWSTVAELRANAHPDAVEAEWHAQIDRAIDAGIDVSHLDAHMGSALAPEWCDRYIALGVEYGVPVLMTETLGVYGPNNHLVDVTDEQFAPFVEQARGAGMPIFGRVLETDFGRRRGAGHDYPALLESAGEDLVYCAFHPCRPGPGEVEIIEPDAHHVRVDEYELFHTEDWKAWLDGRAIEFIGMRELRDDWRRRHRSDT